MSIPPWLKAHLETVAGAPIGARNARPLLCPRCHAWTLVGLDADLLAFTARTDPTPLTAAGELVAALTSRTTYDLTQTGGHLQLWLRDPEHLRAHPPGTGPNDVLPAHRCRQQLGGHLVTTSRHATTAHALPDRPAY